MAVAAVAVANLWMEVRNVAMDIGMAVRGRRYNPGLVTVVLLVATHAVAGARWVVRSGRLVDGPAS